MGQGRHRAGNDAGHRRTSTGVRKAAPGARKAPPEARRASPARAGGARVTGRRVADGGGRPVVLTALGSGEKVFALLPLAILSVASVAGLATNANDEPATSTSPAEAGTAAGPVGHQAAALRQVPASETPTSARPAISETAAPVVTGEDTVPETVDAEPESDDGPTASGPRVEPPAEPTDRSTAAPPPAAPTESPTTTPDAPDDNVLTRAQATAQCLESGISTLDVVALVACVEELLG